MFYSISPLGRNRIKQHSSILIPHHRNTINIWKTQLSYDCSSKLNSPVGSNLIRRSSSSLQRKHENTLHYARSGASLVSYLFSEN
jgi:hypothetical protein